MAHWSGLLTKSDISGMEAVYTNSLIKNEVELIKSIIISLQTEGLINRRLVVNRVVHDDVVKFFKNEMQYTTIDNKAGQAPNFTMFLEVSW